MSDLADGFCLLFFALLFVAVVFGFTWMECVKDFRSVVVNLRRD